MVNKGIDPGALVYSRTTNVLVKYRGNGYDDEHFEAEVIKAPSLQDGFVSDGFVRGIFVPVFTKDDVEAACIHYECEPKDLLVNSDVEFLDMAKLLGIPSALLGGPPPPDKFLDPF